MAMKIPMLLILISASTRVLSGFSYTLATRTLPTNAIRRSITFPFQRLSGGQSNIDGGIHSSSRSRAFHSSHVVLQAASQSNEYPFTSSEGSGELRTGWLHNTEPKWLIEQREKQEASLLSQNKSAFSGGIMKYSNHRIISPPAFHACGEGRVVVVTEHKLSVPLSRNVETVSSREVIDIYFTIAETIASEKERQFFENGIMQEGPDDERALAYKRHANMDNADDSIIYLQGGPGFGAPTPAVGIGLSGKSSWVGEAFSKGFKRVVLMDQRGTGRSTTITKQTLERKFPDLFALDEQASALGGYSITLDQSAKSKASLNSAIEYMSNFRADNIVFDSEAIRECLLRPGSGSEKQPVEASYSNENSTGPRPWGAALGQSFGGFCMMTYLSLVSNPPKICLLTGGIAPMVWPVDKVYDSLWERVRERNYAYYEHYPGDIKTVKRIVQALLQKPERLPSNGLLTARRFLQLGMGLGGSPSAFASLHSTISSAFIDEHENVFSKSFLKAIDSQQPFDDHPIYFLLHESIYADGGAQYEEGAGAIPTNWSAHRMFEKRIRNPSDFSYELTSRLDSDTRPTLFFGEMVFPWMADGDYAECSGLGMKSLAHGLAQKDDWGALYDKENIRRALTTCSKAAAAIYFDDLYVDFDACRQATSYGGPLEKCKVWITNEYQHSGIRDGGGTIFAKLFEMAKGSLRVPS